VFLTLLAEGILVCPAGGAGGTLVEGYPLEHGDWMGVRDVAASVLALARALGLDPLQSARLTTPFRHLVASQRGNGRVVWRDVFRLAGISEG